MTLLSESPQIKRVLHIVSGDRWAGAESQVYALLYELKKYFHVYAIVMNEGALARKLREANINVYIVDESKISGFTAFKQILSLVRSISPDIVHTHRKKENIVGSIANALSRRVPCVRTTHGAPEFSPSGVRALVSHLDKFCGRHLQHGIISVSDELKELLTEHYDPSKIYTIYNGISKAQLPSLSCNKSRYSNTDVNIGIVGRLDPVKRLDIFIDTATQLIASHPEKSFKFHIFGEGRLESELKKVVLQSGCIDEILFHGHVSDAISHIKSMDIVVMCSDHEGLPMTALESLAVGTPVVAHSVGGLTTLLKRYPKLLVDNHTPTGYVNAITQLISEPYAIIDLPDIYEIEHTATITSKLYSDLHLQKK